MEAVGPISVPMQCLVDAMALSATFRARVSAASEDALRERIHFPHLIPPIWEVARPCAVLMSAPILWEHVASGGGNYLRPSGAIDVIIVDNDQYPDDLTTSQIDFENFIGQTMAEVVALAGVDDRLSITRVEQTVQASLPDPTDQPSAGSFWLSKFHVQWGRV